MSVQSPFVSSRNTIPTSGVFATMWQNDAVFGDLHDRAEVAGVLGLAGVRPARRRAAADRLDRQSVLHRRAQARSTPTTRHSAARGLLPGSPPNARAGSIASRQASRQLLQPRLTIQMSGVRACSSTPAKIRPPAPPRAAPSRGLVRHGWVESGREVTLRQGLEIGRPSRIVVRAVRQGEGVGSITVSGSTIPVARGAFFLPV